MERKPPKHTEMTYFPVQEGHLVVGGQPLAEVAAIVGQTPFYVYDRQVIDAKIQQFRSHIPSRIKLHYAMKANPMPSLVSYVGRQVDGLDVASHKEMLVALATDVEPEYISFAGPGKSITEIRAAVAAGVTLNAESELEIERAIEAGADLRRTPKIAIRINPDFELKTSGMKMGGGPKQFGIDAERVPDVMHYLQQKGADFRGFHIYSGSQNLKYESIVEAHNKTFELASRLVSETGISLAKLNIGGGFGIPYFPGEQPLDLAPIGENLNSLLEQHQDTLGNTRIVIELGRFLVGESGLYVCKVNDKKISRGKTYLVVDGGLHHHLANSGNFGQVLRKNYPVTIVKKTGTGETETVTIVGPLCTPLDTLADNMELPEAEIGDLVVIYQSGAYGATASPRGFLSQPDLGEILL